MLSHFWEGLPTLLANCWFCGCLIVLVCLSLWCWGLYVDYIVSVPEFIYLFFFIDVLMRSSWCTSSIFVSSVAAICNVGAVLTYSPYFYVRCLEMVVMCGWSIASVYMGHRLTKRSEGHIRMAKPQTGLRCHASGQDCIVELRKCWTPADMEIHRKFPNHGTLLRHLSLITCNFSSSSKTEQQQKNNEEECNTVWLQSEFSLFR